MDAALPLRGRAPRPRSAAGERVLVSSVLMDGPVPARASEPRTEVRHCPSTRLPLPSPAAAAACLSTSVPPAFRHPRLRTPPLASGATTGIAPRPREASRRYPCSRQTPDRLSGSAIDSALPRQSPGLGGITPIRALPRMWRAVPCDASTACAAALAARHWVVTSMSVTPSRRASAQPRRHWRPSDGGTIAARHHAVISFFLTGSLAATGPNADFAPRHYRKLRRRPEGAGGGSDGGAAAIRAASLVELHLPTKAHSRRSRRSSSRAVGRHDDSQRQCDPCLVECLARAVRAPPARATVPTHRHATSQHEHPRQPCSVPVGDGARCHPMAACGPRNDQSQPPLRRGKTNQRAQYCASQGRLISLRRHQIPFCSQELFSFIVGQANLDVVNSAPYPHHPCTVVAPPNVCHANSFAGDVWGSTASLLVCSRDPPPDDRRSLLRSGSIPKRRPPMARAAIPAGLRPPN